MLTTVLDHALGADVLPDAGIAGSERIVGATGVQLAHPAVAALAACVLGADQQQADAMRACVDALRAMQNAEPALRMFVAQYADALTAGGMSKASVKVRKSEFKCILEACLMGFDVPDGNLQVAVKAARAHKKGEPAVKPADDPAAAVEAAARKLAKLMIDAGFTSYESPDVRVTLK